MLLDEITKIIDEEMKLSNDDEKVEDYLDQEYDLLIKSLDKTIEVINTIDRDHFHFLVEIFPDLSLYFQSDELLQAMKNNVVKYNDEFALSDLAYSVIVLANNDYAEADFNKVVNLLTKELFNR